MGFLHVVVPHANLRSGVDSWLEGDGLLAFGWNIAEMRVRELDKLVVVDGSSANHHHAWRRVVCVNVVLDHLTIHRVDVLSGAKNGAPQGRTSKSSLVESVKYNLFDLSLDLLHLSENRALLSINVFWIKVRVLENICKDLESLPSILLEDTRKEHGLLPGGVSVQVATHVLNLHFQLALGAVLGSLKEHVLEEVRNAVVFLSFVSASSVNPHSDSDRVPRKGLRSYPHAIRELAHRSLR
mmetsp:Transcript_26851/g.37472  ORF Transcript_26851/g.37472 Transcript_26851/m.37472 type:complete len:240 (+) Transcript_26851:802-1521(+)